MNGPSFPQGDPMVNATTPKWSDEEAAKAEMFLKALGTFDKKNGFPTNKNHAAKALGYKSYAEIPFGIKSYVSHKAAKVKKEFAQGEIKDRVMHHLAQMKEDWEQQYETDANFRHAMTHPDEESLGQYQ